MKISFFSNGSQGSQGQVKSPNKDVEIPAGSPTLRQDGDRADNTSVGGISLSQNRPNLGANARKIFVSRLWSGEESYQHAGFSKKSHFIKETTKPAKDLNTHDGIIGSKNGGEMLKTAFKLGRLKGGIGELIRQTRMQWKKGSTYSVDYRYAFTPSDQLLHLRQRLINIGAGSRDNETDRKIVEKSVYLRKIAFANAAQKCNAKVRYMFQHTIIWGAIGQQRFDSNFWLGVCAGLAIEWIKAKKNKFDFISDLTAARDDVFTPELDNRQFLDGIAGGIIDSHRLQNSLNTAFNGVCIPVGDVVSSNYPFSNAFSSMRKGNFYYISTGGHAMAAVPNDENKIDFYDPSVGEMSGITKEALRCYLKDAVDLNCLLAGDSDDSIKGKKYNIKVTGFH